jgi:S-adenosylmethionine synthetase
LLQFGDFGYIYFINLKAEKMKKLFCVVVTDPDYVIGLDSPIIFHIKCEDSNTAEEEAVNEMVGEEYGYDPQDVDNLDIFSFEVTDLDIIEL